MRLYIGIIGAAMLAVSILNVAFAIASAVCVVISVILCTAFQFALDGLIAFAVNKLPDRLFGVENPAYRVSEWEKRLYKRLRVRKWKDRVWELGGLGGFSKKKLLEPGNPKYIEKFIIECNKGVLTHRLSYPAGFLAMLFYNDVRAFSIALPVASVNLFLNVLPTLALRYNTPKLKAILKRMKRNGSSK